MNGDTPTLQIKVLDPGSVHKISSGQVVVDLQTAVKDLVENSLDAGATSIEVRFKDYGLESFEVIDNGSGLPSQDHDYIALKHHTSKLASFTDLETVTTFGFRGEALSSLCALSDALSVTTATAAHAPAGTVIEFDRTGKAKAKKGKAARQRGTTVSVSGLFKPLPVRRKELERNARREHAKALALLHAYALVPCAHENHGVCLTVTNQTVQGFRTDGTPSTPASVTAIWGPKALEHLVDLDFAFPVEVDAAVLRRLGPTQDDGRVLIVFDNRDGHVKGLISRFAVGSGRNGTDRQYFFVNGRPCAPSKVQKAVNEVYRSFNATQAPFVVADFILPTNSCDINVSPDKRTILLHSENNLVQALKVALEETYASSRSTFDVNPSQPPRKADTAPPTQRTQAPREDEATAEQDKDKDPLFLPDEQAEESHAQSQHDGDGIVQSDKGADASAFGEPALLLELSRLWPSRALDGEEEDQDPLSDVDGETPRSSTVTQMVNTGARARANDDGPLDSEDDEDVREDEDDDDAPRASQRPLAKLLEARRNATLATTGHGGGEAEEEEEDAPIPSLGPPVHPVAHARESVRAKAGGSGPARGGGGGGEQMRREGVEEEQGGGQAGMKVLLSLFARKGNRVEEDVREEEEDEQRDGEEYAASEDGAREVVPGETMDVEMREVAETELSDGTVDEVEVMEEERPAVIDITQVDDLGLVQLRAKRAGRSDVGRSAVSATSEEKKLRECLADALRDQEDHERDTKAKLGSTAGVSNTDDDETVEALSRVIDKPDFATMEIIRQFNLGFIIVRRLKPRAEGDGASGEEMEMDDLFIVDQHAADEKYNFETLQRTTKIESQQMIRQVPSVSSKRLCLPFAMPSPEVLELTAADELVVLENMDVLRQNGFELDVAEDRPAGQRVRMTAHPVSGTTKFDAKGTARWADGAVFQGARAMFAMHDVREYG
ncbi:DNA mismatch repair protein MutL [Ganoderma leucocontextum]|nr:DNA mismatch repair protein MutL [Ganoderma leucocontextum]